MVQRDDIDSLLNEEEFSVDLDNEAVLKETQARSEVLDKVAEFCNLDRQDPQIQKRGYGHERTAEDQPFFHVPRNPEDPRTRVDISSGSASLSASQLIDQEAMSRKNAAAVSTALSLAEYIDNYPGMPELLCCFSN